MANPIKDPKSCDTIKLGGKVSPGLAEVTGGHAPRKIDVRKGYGLTGASTVFTGIDIDGFQVRLSFVTQAEIDDYDTNFVPLLAAPPSGTNPKALDFYHPLVSDPPIGVRSVLVQDVSQLTRVGDDGLWIVDIKLMPFVKTKPALAKPTASTGAPAAAKPQDAADKIIADLTAQVKGLG